MICRCGFADDGSPHPCHGKAYTCGKPATMRLYNARPAPLAGMQFKLVADDTWACDDCWKEFNDGRDVPQAPRGTAEVQNRPPVAGAQGPLPEVQGEAGESLSGTPPTHR